MASYICVQHRCALSPSLLRYPAQCPPLLLTSSLQCRSSSPTHHNGTFPSYRGLAKSQPSKNTMPSPQCPALPLELPLLHFTLPAQSTSEQAHAGLRPRRHLHVRHHRRLPPRWPEESTPAECLAWCEVAAAKAQGWRAWVSLVCGLVRLVFYSVE